MEEVARRLNAAVRVSRLNPEDLAGKVGITPAALSRILEGKEQRLDLATIAALAHSVDTTVGHLLGEPGFEYSPAEAIEFRRVLDSMAQIAGPENEEWADEEPVKE